MAGQAIILALFALAFTTAIGLQGYAEYSEQRAHQVFAAYLQEARQLTDDWQDPPPPGDAPLPRGYSIRLSGPYAELLKDGTVVARDLYTRRVVWSDFEQGREGWYCPTWRRCYWQSGDGYADRGYLYLRGYGWYWAVAQRGFAVYENSSIRKATLNFAWNPSRYGAPWWGFYDYRAYLYSDGRWYLLKRGYCRSWRGYVWCRGVQPNRGWQEMSADITKYLGRNMRVAFYERAYPPSFGDLKVDNVAVTVDFGRG